MLGDALHMFSNKLMVLGAHMPLLDNIERIEFEDKEHNYAQSDAQAYIFNAGEFRITSHKKDLSADECMTLDCCVYFRYKPENINGRIITKFYRQFDRLRAFSGSVYIPQNRTFVIKNCKPVADSEINPNINIDENNCHYADLFFGEDRSGPMYIPEIFEIARVLRIGYKYSDFLRDTHSDGLESILMNYYYCSGFSYNRVMNNLVRKVGYFKKTSDAALPDYIKDKHPVAGVTELFLIFGDHDYAISQPWSPMLRNKSIREYCDSHGCNVYLLKSVPNKSDMVICIYDGTMIDDEGEEHQIVTETTGHEDGVVSKELALSCFIPYEKAQELCDEFFGNDDDDEYEN